MRRSTMKMVGPRVARVLAVVAVAASMGACAPRYDGFECEELNETPSGSLCTDRRIEVAQGEALVVRLAPRSDSRTEYEGAQVELRSVEPQIADVRAGVGGDQTIIGLSLGETTLEVWVDGALESDVPVRVLPSRPSVGRD
ncbi:MAG: hypothetical protein AB1Z98_39870 [Nannocystaceae bacterium]